MALFQPTNVIPSTLSGEGNGTVDVSKPLTVSWQVNGNSPMVAYRIKIMQNDTDSTLMLDTGKVTLNTPFSGADRLGNPIFFSTVIPAADLFLAGIVNGYANGYKMSIEQWWTANDSVFQSSASYFITRSEPTLVLIDNLDHFSNLNHVFRAIYLQAQGDTVEWYRWEMQMEVDGVYVTVDDTGPIFGGRMEFYGIGETSDYYKITYAYSGFVIGTSGLLGAPGVKYRLRCTLQTENGVFADSGWKNFESLNIGTLTPVQLSVCNVKDKDAIKISMPKNFPLLGETTGPYEYEETSTFVVNLVLPEGSSATWGGTGDKTLDIRGGPYTVAVRGTITDVDAGNTYFIANTRYDEYNDPTQLQFAYDANGFSIRFGNIQIWGNNVQPENGMVFSIAITSETVYFAYTQNGQTQTEQTPISIPAHSWYDNDLKSVTLNGPMKFCDVLIEKGNMEWWDFYTYFVFQNNSPMFTDGTMLILGFAYTLYTGGYLIEGVYSTVDSKVHYTTELAIYRKEIADSYVVPIAGLQVSPDTKDAVIYDYSVRNGAAYEYYFLTVDGDGYARRRNGIKEITPCFWNYTVLCCDEDNNGDYIVQKEYRFALDITSGNVGNNNTPGLQQNFTRYPLRQPASGQYRSGTLSAYIGKAENGQYVDTSSLMEELYALSTSKQIKFLKTRKGQILRIETSAPVVMNIGDKYAQQPAKISLPWVEVGDAKSANILGGSVSVGDTPTFTVNPETMELMMTYSETSKMGAGAFQLVDQDLYAVDTGVYSEEDFSLNANREVIFNTSEGR